MPPAYPSIPCSGHPCNPKSFLLQQGADAAWLVALNFDGPVLGGAAATTGGFELARQGFDIASADMRRKIVDDNDGLAAAMRLLPAQHHPAQLGRLVRFGIGGRGCRRCAGARGQTTCFQRGEGIVQPLAAGSEIKLLLFSHRGKFVNPWRARGDESRSIPTWS